MEISIVYEDADLIVINKPAGLLTHPVNRNDKSDSVVGWVLKKYPEIKNVLDKQGVSFGQWVDLRPGIVHRLDRETSGLLIIAKNQPAFDYLKKQFQERKIKKTYLALVYGCPKNKTGRIESPLGKIGTKQTTQTRGKRELKEKPAITEFQVISSYKLGAEKYSLLEVSPQTGRTHQIRIHLKASGHPIVCDEIYAGKRAICPTDLGRLFLHAQRLEFSTPSGQRLTLEADLPSLLANFIEKLPKAAI